MAFAPEADHTAAATSLVWVNKPGAAKGVRRVVIPFFQVQFVVDSDTSASAGTASSTMKVRLVGPTSEQMQAMTDRLYDRLVQDLTAAGLEVVPTEQARAYGNFAKLQDGGKVSGTRVDGHQGVNSLFFAPHGMTFYFLPTQDIAYTGAGSFGGFGTAMLPPKEQGLMTESDAAVLGFRAVVDFAQLSNNNKVPLRMLRSTARTKASATIAIRPIATQLWLMTPQAKPGVTDMQNRMRFEVQAPLLVDTDAITAMTDARTGGDRRSEALGNALGMLMGGGSSKLRKYDVNVDPEVWARDVEASLNGVEAMFVARLRGEL
ncbi:hypothetical protein [Novosphingobium sp. JCM 18896]|uniref:hypothetical protein n=1 Tax=Novosphingobium sp. JCM 18896 TaxID=2989731 RepID=UPI002221BF3F|nr:hypothetical protein [Novosphingobium sp. JCM 18896]MCW1432261.1 hypothetical protein [Novosphingobium sp. JCM 18896]